LRRSQARAPTEKRVGTPARSRLRVEIGRASPISVERGALEKSCVRVKAPRTDRHAAGLWQAPRGLRESARHVDIRPAPTLHRCTRGIQSQLFHARLYPDIGKFASRVVLH